MKSTVEIKKRPEKLLKELERVSKQFGSINQVKVGLPKGTGNYPDGTSVLMVGIVHEFGWERLGIPERSFLRSTLSNNKRQYKGALNRLAVRVRSGNLTMEKAVGLLGLKVQSDVRQTITDLKEPPLQYRDGNPLIDTGLLRQSITYVTGGDGDV